MAPAQPKTGLFVGLNKGHVTTKKELAPRPSDRKGKTRKRVHFVRNLIREVAGFALGVGAGRQKIEPELQSSDRDGPFKKIGGPSRARASLSEGPKARTGLQPLSLATCRYMIGCPYKYEMSL